MGIILLIPFGVLVWFIYTRHHDWSMNRHARIMNRLNRKEKRIQLDIMYQSSTLEEKRLTLNNHIQELNISLEYERVKNAAFDLAIQQKNAEAMARIQTLNSLAQAEITKLRLLSDEQQKSELQKLLSKSTESLRNISQELENNLDGTY